MGFIVQQGVGVTHHTIAKAGDGQAIAQPATQRHRIGRRILQLCQGDHDATDGDGLQTIRSRDTEGALYAQRLLAGIRAVGQIIFEYHPFTAFASWRQIGDDNAIIAAGDSNGQIGGTGVAIGIGQGVAVDLSQRLAFGQSLYARVAVVQSKAVLAIALQLQSAQSTFDRLRGYHSAIGTLGVRGQNVTLDRQ